MPTVDRLTTALSDRYRIERELGAGGMATVYLAEDLKHDRRVAIKVLKPELAAVLGAERFIVEIKTTAALQHPHILPLFDSGTADGFLFYVMPFIDGETLRAKLDRETQLGVDEAVRITTQVADALDYAHRRGVIHRDIKPENILMHDGRPMVADFGIALAVSAAAGGRMTETGLSLGTPHYMSPEQATADRDITGRADIYSLASVLYEMLTGDPPHTGSSAQQIIMKIITEPAAAVTKVRKNVPHNVAAALAQALEKLPADRFESAKAFADALGNRSWTSVAMAEDSARSHSPDQRALRRLLLAVSAFAVLTTAIAGWALLRPAAAPPVARFPLLLPDSQALNKYGAYTTLATLTPDGRTLAYISGVGQTRRLWVRPFDQLNAVPLAGTELAINPSVSPDGTRIAFVSNSTPLALKVVPIAGGTALTLTDSLMGAGGVSWGYDGYIYYQGNLANQEAGGLMRIRETGGQPEVASRPDTSRGEGAHSAPSALPNGRGVLMRVQTNTSKGNTLAIAVLDTRSGTHRVLVRGISAHYAESGHLLYVTEDGLLMAAPFDQNSLRITGDAVLVGNGVSTGIASRRTTLSMSRNGTLAYLAGSVRVPARELVWVGRDGVARAVDSSWTGDMRGLPALSPDGRSVAVSVGEATDAQLWVKQLDRGPARRVADAGSQPSWSPDGKSLVFSAGGGKLMTVPADGSVLPSAIPGNGAAPQYSPDGQWLFYSVRGDRMGRRTTGDTTPVPVARATGGFAQISPDGRWFAYGSTETGTARVYVRPFPDTKVAERQVSTGKAIAYGPRWSRSGRELFFYQYDENGVASLFSVDVAPGPVFTAGTPKRLFSAEPFGPPGTYFFDVGPDEQRFLFTRRVSGGDAGAQEDRIVIVQNFTAELKAKVPK